MSSDKLFPKRLIFKRNLDPNQDYRGQLVDLSRKPEQRWLLWERKLEDREKQIAYELTWVTPDKQTGIHYIEDYIVGFPYVVIDGKEIEKVTEAICSHFEIYSPSELFQIVENPSSTRLDKVEAVLRLGVIAPQEFEILNSLEFSKLRLTIPRRRFVRQCFKLGLMLAGKRLCRFWRKLD